MASGKGWLRVALEDFLETFGIGKKISDYFIEKAENWERSWFTLRKRMMDQLKDIPGLPDQLKEAGIEGIPGIAQTGIGEIIGFSLSVGQQAAMGFMGPVTASINQIASKLIRWWRPDVSTLASLYFRFPQQAETWNDVAKELGVHDELWLHIKGLLQRRLPENLLLTLMLRGDLPENIVSDELQKRGWTVTDIDGLFKTAHLIPQVGDLIRMQVRDAWNEEAITKFGYDQGDRSQVKIWAAKQGLDPDWVDRFWYAHWDLPSMQMGFEMLHRLRDKSKPIFFGEEELRLLAKTADIAPNFIDRLMAISYTPYTRVDVRRMFGSGILNEQQVYDSYRDIGYDDEHAKNLTKFTTTVEKTEERALTKDLIMSALARRVYTPEQAKSALVDLGWTDQDADLIISIQEAQQAQKKVDSRISAVHSLFVNGQIEESGVYTRLGPLNLPSDQVNDLIVTWTVEREGKISLPSVGDLETWYRDNMITVEEWRSGMKKRRYLEPDIELYLRKIDLEVQEAAALAQARALAEQEKIAAKAEATEYQKLQAGLNVELAQTMLDIADLKVALQDQEDVEVADQMQLEIVALARHLLELRLQKAQATLERLH